MTSLTRLSTVFLMSVLGRIGLHLMEIRDIVQGRFLLCRTPYGGRPEIPPPICPGTFPGRVCQEAPGMPAHVLVLLPTNVSHIIHH